MSGVEGSSPTPDSGSIPWTTYVLAAIGVYALCWWLIDNLRSLVQVLAAVLMPFFQPQEDVSLVQRFGEWAGNCSLIIFD